MTLPSTHEPYTDKYFLRTKEILQKENLNPYVRAQVFIRKGPGVVAGIDEAVAILKKYSNLEAHGGKVYAKREGDRYESKETLMVIEAPAQDIVTLETMYLGAISAATTKANGGNDVTREEVTHRMSGVVKAAQGKPVIYFGARHWSWDKDAMIASAAYDGGAVGASTDIGAATFGQEGRGTMPHFLENIKAWQYGMDRAVLEAGRSFNRNIASSVPRIVLIDYNNREISDSLAVADDIPLLTGVRVDTCGENVMQGGMPYWNEKDARDLFGKKITIPDDEQKYWAGTGVTISGVYALSKALAEAKQDIKITLSSGFGDPRKVRAFARAEKILGTKLFDDLGVGGVYDSRMATMDVVAVGNDARSLVPMSKVGRNYRPNPNLEQVLGSCSRKEVAA